MATDPNYPKAKYKAVTLGEGDQIGKFNAGRHSYVSAVVADEEEEKALGEGWHDFPDMTDRPKAESSSAPFENVYATALENYEKASVETPRRGPGRPRKFEAEE